MTTYRILQQMNHALTNLDALLTKAEEHAKAHDLDPNELLQARFAPDMHPFTRQIQIACDHLKNAAARLSGQTPPVHEDTEQTFEELHARIKKAQDYFLSIAPADLEAAAEQRITLGFLPGFYLTGLDYLHEMAVPNFYFHATTAYDLLRNKGLAIGKRDFLGKITLNPLDA